MHDSFLAVSASHKSSCLAKQYLVFLVTGNPGLIAYYNSFLTTLHLLLSPHASDESNPDSSRSLAPDFQIFGRSLPGFEDDDSLAHSAQGRSTPYGLQEVIDRVFDTLKAQRIATGERKGELFDGVILVGHSVGSYILLELLGRIRQDNPDEGLKVKAGILLFPTVTHIAQSPSGIKITALFRIPDFPRIFSRIATGTLKLFPQSILKWFVATVTRMPENAAEVTTRFLLSKGGIWQALHMARDEMRIITEDKWDEEIWGVEKGSYDPKESIPKLIFYFGRNDHWVADHTRDSLIAARGQMDSDIPGKPKMLIDQDGIPHDFCIKHGELVAEKVKVWIDEVVTVE